MIEYDWWGGKNSPPDNLKTKKQLAEIGLRPVKAVGVISTRKYDLLLYDSTDLNSVAPKRKASEKQKEALAKGRRSQQFKAWYRQEGRFYQDRNDAIEWAKNVLNDDTCVILDTETTGLGEAEIVQIGIIDMKGQILFDSFVKPTISIPVEASNIHAIKDDDVKDAPIFPDIYPQIKEVLQGKTIIIYNEEFDRTVVNYCCKLHRLPRLISFKNTNCAMQWAAQYEGQWSDYYGGYKWQPLAGDHNAISDCLACLTVIKNMADNKVESVEAIFDSIYNKGF